MATTSTSSSVFSGNSRYASDFQAVIDRSVAIASLPITQLHTDKTNLQDQSTALSAIDAKFTDLQTAVSNLQDALGGSSYEASVSDDSLVSVSVDTGALEGIYSIEVDDIGAYASSMTASSWTTAAAGTRYHLAVGGYETDITPAANDAASVASAINSKAGAKVRATVVNVGSSSTPDYRIVLQATHLGDMTPKLTKDSVDLQSEQTKGRVAKYIVSGSGKTVESDTRNVTIATGVAVNLLASNPGTTVDITLTRSSSTVSGALSAFATAYNAATDELDKQRGTAGGVLGGQSLISQLSNTLRGIATWSQSGSTINGLGDLGLKLGSDGRFVFNAYSFLATSIQSSAAISSFLGDAGSGGFLKFVNDSLSTIENADGGSLKAAETSVTNQITSTDARIADEQTRVDNLKTRLEAKMAEADALIAAMEQQYSYVASMFTAMKSASDSYR